MSEQIHSVLDGELPPEALTPSERLQLQEMQAVIGAVVERLHAVPAPDLVGRVMHALPAPDAASVAKPMDAATGAGARPWRRALAWLWQPQPLQLSLRPAYALVGALALVVGVTLAGRWLAPGAERLAGGEVRSAAPAGPAAGPEDEVAAPRIYVQFRLDAPDAEQVELAGSFTGWRPAYLLQETEPGVWTALVPLSPGVHDYAFVVDGERWVADPHAFQVPDSFGGTNSRLSLPPPSGST